MATFVRTLVILSAAITASAVITILPVTLEILITPLFTTIGEPPIVTLTLLSLYPLSATRVAE